MAIAKEKVIFLIPAFNEGKVIYRTIAPIINVGYKVVCIDDGSRDNTSSEARRAGAIVIKHILNLGQGAALETGLEYLRRNLDEFDYAVTFDADGQHELSNIDEMIKIMETKKVQIVLGTRFKEENFQGGKLKSYLLRISARLALYSIGIRVSDRHNGLRMLTQEAVQKIRIKDLGFGHADEILICIRDERLNYAECPVSILYTDYSKSKGQPLINLVNILFDRIARFK